MSCRYKKNEKEGRHTDYYMFMVACARLSRILSFVLLATICKKDFLRVKTISPLLWVRSLTSLCTHLYISSFLFPNIIP